jgi:hypothetical protein
VSAPVPSREDCIRAARVEVDRARWETARDYAAGRLTGERLEAYERLLAEYAPHALLSQRAVAA